MKIFIDEAALLPPLQRAASVAGRSTINPAIGLALIEVVDAVTVSLKTTDGEALYEARIPANVAEAPDMGGICVDAQHLLGAVSAMSGGVVALEQSGHGLLHVSVGGAVRRLRWLAADQFPPHDLDDEMSSFSMSAEHLAEVVRRVYPHIAADVNRGGLHGAHLEGADARVTFVATNGHTLSVVDSVCTGTPRMPDRVVIPRDVFGVIGKLAASEEGDVKVEISERVIRVTGAAQVYTARMMDGEFPDWRAVMAHAHKGVKRTATAPRERLISALGGARAVVRASVGEPPVAMSWSRDGLVVSCSSHDAGSAEARVDAELDGAKLTIGVDLGYLDTSLRAFDGVDVRFRLGDAKSPLLLSDPSETQRAEVFIAARLLG